MKIGIDASRANIERRSGTEWYSYYLIKELAKIDSENQYVLYTDKPLVHDLLNLNDNERSTDESFDRRQEISSPYANFQVKLLKWPFKYLWTQGRLSLEMLIDPPDLLFVPSHTLPIVHPRRSIVTIHDVAFERDRTIYQKREIAADQLIFKKVMNFLARLFTFGRYGANTTDYLAWSTVYGLKNAKKIITVSEFSRQEIRSVYKDILPEHVFDKISVVHNGFDNNIFCKSVDNDRTEAILKKYGIVKPYVFYLGRIERKKNIPNLIEAFGLLKSSGVDINLVLTGASSYGSDEVGYMISEYGLDKNVNRTGWVDESDLPYIFNQAAAFVFPSLHEGFGIPLLEAMACGVPVAASTAPAIMEVCSDCAIYFNPRDIHDMAKALKIIVTDNDKRKMLVQAGFERASKFDWTICAKKTLEVINSLKS